MESTLFLLQMAGTSGVGKSTLARMIGAKTGAVIIDYDVLKSAALDAGCEWDMSGRVGYMGAWAIADAVLQQGLSVILDSPCRFQKIVDEGTMIAQKRGATYAFIECVLADETELRRRMRSRVRQRSQRIDLDVPPSDAPSDPMVNHMGSIQIPETKFPTSPWLRIDTSQPLDYCLTLALTYLEEVRGTRLK